MRQPRGDAALTGPVEGRRAALWWKVLGVVCCGVSVWGCSSWGRAQGLSAEADALAPHLLSVPGEAMLIDPPSRPGGREDGTESPQAPQLRLPADEVGLASWYGAKFHKRRTASGEPFDMKALTAAHPTLPFGSRVCVRSQATGRSVVVRINDRGPHTGNRVIDLSRGAAEVLGMVGLGLKPVELFALDEGERDCPAP
ncbi:septal ring lytic transglycosylase RlpA family protein [Acidovorax sp. sif1233]|uniref:septal ring lytic transglycosylase RlpA family protein n=1 Tax=Acidovorax sp. sif1233 TaxID=2854792 RepID=UPI001C46F60D|nr:septal ring lytic transglycosylase RlpA family protein [Acidovorax sp. sif1233]MBV7456105.1 septal ring lytic transglycosylase RlpA family protein [Acidovorax sp. sif1233]